MCNRGISRRVATVFPFLFNFMESRESCLAADGRAWKVDGRAQALVGPGLATPLTMQTHCCLTAEHLLSHFVLLTPGYAVCYLFWLL